MNTGAVEQLSGQAWRTDPHAGRTRRRRRAAALGALGGAALLVAATIGLAPHSHGIEAARAGDSHAAARRHLHPPVARTSAAATGRGAIRAASARASPADRLASLPFAPDRRDRRPAPGELPSLYADGAACSIGCRPDGAQLGWPLRPFRVQHPLRAGLNELRPQSLHVGLDIQARDGAAVYAVQGGVARVLAAVGPNARVQVGSFVYWHIDPRVRSGDLVLPFATILGTVTRGYGHIAFSELDRRGNYVNPLRPAGRVLEPYADRAAPVIGAPVLAAGGQVLVSAYDPQTFIRRTTYVTPVLAPAALAYRLYSPAGVAVTPLRWAFRGTHLLPFARRALIFAADARAPGYQCFATRSVCVPHWSFRVAGGLAPPLPSRLAPGRYRLTIYAWDWADNTTARDSSVLLTAAGWRDRR